MNPKVGLSSIAGWATFVAAELGFVGTAITGTEAQLHGPGKWLAILGVASLAVTNAGRYLQSHGLIKAGGTAATVLDDGGAGLAALAAEAQGNVAKLAGSPDAVDSPAVPFSGDQPAAPPAP